MGAAGTFAVLAGTTATNTGPSVVSGDLGVSPGSAVTGFPPGLAVIGAMGFIIGPIIAALFLTVWEFFEKAYRSDLSAPTQPDVTLQSSRGPTTRPPRQRRSTR